MNVDEPLIVLPVMQTDHKIVVGYGDGSVRSLSATMFESVLNGGGNSITEKTPRPSFTSNN